jgi:hypothetical protein
MESLSKRRHRLVFHTLGAALVAAILYSAYVTG